MRALVCGVGEKGDFRVNVQGISIGGRVRGDTSQNTPTMLCQKL